MSTPLVISGSQDGLTASAILQQVAGEVGRNPQNDRFRNLVLGWINEVIRRVQLVDSKLRHTTVHQATVTFKRGVVQYEVTDSIANGGFGWTNCHEVLLLIIPAFSNLPLETVDLEDFRQRWETQNTVEGPPHTWVPLSKTRVRIYPTPDADYVGEGDYLQEQPSITDFQQQVSWPRTWDQVLIEGVRYHAFRNYLKDQRGIIRDQKQVYDEHMVALQDDERVTPVRPGRAVVTRRLRSRRYVYNDNSTDARRW